MEGQNSRWKICEVLRVVRSHEGAGELQRVFSKVQAQERQSRRFKPTGVVGFGRGFSFQGFMSGSPEIFTLRLAKCEVPKRRKV
jgi:hypothetical protein